MNTPALSIINFVYFTANFPYNFIEECWGYNTMESSHMRMKLEGSQKKSGVMTHITSGAMIDFFFDLSRSNQTKLAEWIEANYHFSSVHQ